MDKCGVYSIILTMETVGELSKVAFGVNGADFLLPQKTTLDDYEPGKLKIYTDMLLRSCVRIICIMQTSDVFKIKLNNGWKWTQHQY